MMQGPFRPEAPATEDGIEAEFDAPAPDHMLDLHQRCADIIRKRYFIHTRNEKLAHETAMAVLEEVMRTYETIAAVAASADRENGNGQA